jgi:hypothetical protein
MIRWEKEWICREPNEEEAGKKGRDWRGRGCEGHGTDWEQRRIDLNREDPDKRRKEGRTMATFGIPRGAIAGAEAETLLQEAEEAFPSSEFVASLWDWFDEKGFLTEAQAEGLRGIIDGEREE